MAGLISRSVLGVALAASMIASVGIATASSAEPTLVGGPRRVITPPNPRSAIPNSYIVVLKKSTLTREQVARIVRELVGTHGGRATLQFLVVLRGFVYRGSAKRAARIAADRRVEYVEQDRRVVHQGIPLSGSQTDPPSWGLDRIDQRSEALDHRYNYPSASHGVNAYIIDSGVHATHREFQGRATLAANLSGDGRNDDCSGHGTHVAGTVAGAGVGVAKSARIVALKVFGCDGSGKMSSILAAVDWVTAHGHRPGVINMSLGTDGQDPALAAAIKKSVSAGYSYVVAAGNQHADACDISPALLPNVITVGASTSSDSRDTGYSNYGRCVKIFAPGTNIYSASYTSDTGYLLMAGTSMASPHVTGAAALVLGQNPDYSPRQVADCLLHDSTEGALSSVGSGSPNRLLHVSADYRGCAG